MPLRSRASKAWATDKQVERSMMVCNRFSSFGACCAIFSKDALQQTMKSTLVLCGQRQYAAWGQPRMHHTLSMQRNDSVLQSLCLTMHATK